MGKAMQPSKLPANPTPYADINELLAQLLERVQAIFGEKLVALSLFGSLVLGDFDYDISDIDLAVAISTFIDEQEFARLQTMHNELVAHYRNWENRLEIGYIAVQDLKVTQPHFPIALMSPGEPFHIKEAGADWILNRYVLHEKGVSLYGPSPQQLVDSVSKEELLDAVRVQAKAWRTWVYSGRTRGFQAYAILTMCRIYYTLHTGGFVSKKQAALWTAQALPEKSTLIHQALIWREEWRDEQVDSEATLPETLRFVHTILNLS
jgi:predicted nucleotidyltransferase